MIESHRDTIFRFQLIKHHVKYPKNSIRSIFSAISSVELEIFESAPVFFFLTQNFETVARFKLEIIPVDSINKYMCIALF